MYVTNVGSNRQFIPPPQVVPAAAPEKTVSEVQVKKTDAVSLTPRPAPVYTRSEAESAMKSATEAALKRVAERIITKQYSEGNHFYQLMYGNVALRIDPTLRVKSSEPARRELMEQARAVVGEDGPLSVETTAKQIAGYVKEQAGGDEAKLKRYQAAVEAAFDGMSRMSGGKLPEITQKTYESVMSQLSTDTGTEE